MNLPEGTRLAYIISHEAWYARYPGIVRRPDINISASVPGDGCAWEFSVEDVDQGQHGTAIQLRMFYDAFAAFADIPEFFAALPGVTTLDGVRKQLDALGAVDETRREQP